jgi:hypothetical protein
MRGIVNTRTWIIATVIAFGACGGTKPPRTSLDAGLSDGCAEYGRDDASMPTDDSIANCYATEGDAGGATIATENGGSVIISAAEDITYSDAGTVQALFYRAGQSAYKFQSGSDYGITTLAFYPACGAITVGACAVVSANSGVGCDPAPPSCEPIPSAGTITISGTVFGDLAMTPNPNGTYTPGLLESTGAPVFMDGDILTLSAPGADVPPFQQSIVAPGCVAMEAPSGPDGGVIYGSYVIPTSDDLQISWTGGESNAFVGVTLIGGQGNSAVYASVSCSFDATLGQGTIPHQALAALTGTAGSFFVYQERRSSMQAGSYHVQTIVRNFGSGKSDAGTCPSSNASAVYQ